MNKLTYLALGLAVLSSCSTKQEDTPADTPTFITIDGTDLVDPSGNKFFIRGANLGNWLNPEGYMFGFKKVNSPRFINEMFCQLVGEEETARFWQDFKNNYITRKDIEYIAGTGANTIRLPFHYKLFTDEDYMGLTHDQDGFARVDSVVEWCRANGLYLILDMHDAPGGQTGDNIDDSYGYPWLFESPKAQELFCGIWEKIATRYSDEPVILGYELINEPIAHFFEDKDSLNTKLEPLQKRAVEAIRKVDSNHIILIGGSQWNGNFEPFTDWNYDDKLMYTCHRYGGPATAEAISNFIAFRDSTNRPMYMGEIGHNTMEWQRSFAQVMEDNNIGYSYWPYKKLGESCWMAIEKPDGWDSIITFAESDRSSYDSIRENVPDRKAALASMRAFIEASKAQNCTPQDEYLESMKLSPIKK